MRFGGLILVLALPLLMACKILPHAIDQPAAADTGQTVGGDATLPSGGADTGIRPKPRPPSVAAPADAALEPTVQDPATAKPEEQVVEKSKDQIACEKHAGTWGNAGKTGLKTCSKRTRDAGKQCRKQGDCESVCLARSGTCAPIKPLFGCNEILQKDGSRVTLCLD